MKKVMKYVTMIFIVASMTVISAKPTYSPFFHTIEDLEDYVHSHFGPEGYTWGDGSTSTGNNTDVTQTNPQPEKKTVKSCEHTYESEVTKEANCSEDGELTFTCSKCGDQYKNSIPATGEHTYESEITKETGCTTSGEITYKCTVCEDKYTEEIPSVGHKYNSTVTKPVGCVEAGELTYECSECGDKYTEEIAALGHLKGDNIISKEPGLFTEGEQIYTCDRCNETLETQIIPSQYPITYLYVICGIIIVFSITVVTIITLKKKRKI